MAASTNRILCYGGSFNPIHHGHLLCAQAVAEAAGYEKVLLISAGVPPHRSGQNDMASAADRLTMCRLAVAGSALFDVSDIELRRDGSSFTLDTAGALKREGLSEVHWLIGGDTVPRLPTWHDFTNLMREVHFVVMSRPGSDIPWDGIDKSLKHMRQNVVAGPLIEISASEVRERVRLGRSIEYHVPPRVAAYIEENGLYRAGLR